MIAKAEIDVSTRSRTLRIASYTKSLEKYGRRNMEEKYASEEARL